MTAPGEAAPGRRRAAGVLLLVFAAGVVAGVAVQELRPPKRVRRVQVMPSGAAVFEELSLSPDQRRLIDSIARAARPRMDSLLGRALPRLRALTDSVDADIRRVLTAGQRRTLDSLRAARGATPE